MLRPINPTLDLTGAVGNGRCVRAADLAPLSVRELERILAAARTTEGLIGDVPASTWWTAFILLLADAETLAKRPLALKRSDFNRRNGSIRLTVKYRRGRPEIIRLHKLTIDALNRLRRSAKGSSSTDPLFPWPFQYSSLAARYFDILYRADAGPSHGPVFTRLRTSRRHVPELLNQLDPAASCDLRPGRLSLSKHAEAVVIAPRNAVVLIENRSRQTLRLFLDRVYLPQAIAGCGKNWAVRASKAVDRLCGFCACDVTLDMLSDLLLTEFAEWSKRGRSKSTTRSHLQLLRAMWRLAHQRGLVASCPAGALRVRVVVPWAQKRTEAKTAMPCEPQTVLIGSNSPRTLRNFWLNVYRPKRMIGCKPLSRSEYLTPINKLCAFAACEVTLDQLSDDLLESWMAWSVAAGRAHATVNGYLTDICTLWRYAWRKKFVETQPRSVEKLRILKRLPTAWTAQDFGRILESAARQPGMVCAAPASLFWGGLLLCLFDTGARVGAVVKLSSSALDPERGWLTIPAELQKQGAEQRFRLHSETIEILLSLPRTVDRLFPVPWRDPKPPMARWYRQIVKQAGLPCGPRDLFHRVRRTNATFVADVEGEEAAQRQLGHSSVTLTRRAYIDPRLLTHAFNAVDSMQRPSWSARSLPAPKPAVIPDAPPEPPIERPISRIAVVDSEEAAPLPWLD